MIVVEYNCGHYTIANILVELNNKRDVCRNTRVHAPEIGFFRFFSYNMTRA